MKDTSNYHMRSIVNKVILFVTLGVFFGATLHSGQAYAVCNAGFISATTTTTEFIDNGDGTITHTKTGLMWKRCSEGQLSNGVSCTGSVTPYKIWGNGLKQAEALNKGGGFAGFTDWRVPNINELRSIVENQCTNPAINVLIFPKTQADDYLTSSPSIGGTGIWRVGFLYGIASRSVKDYSTYGPFANYYVRLVRGGQ